MKNELFQIGPVTTYAYGFLIAIGMLAAFYMADKRAKKYQLDDDFIFDMGMLSLLGGLIGAKLLFFITDLQNILSSGNIWNNLLHGFVVYGGLLGGILTGYIFCFIKKKPFLTYFDLVIPSIALAQGFGRIGCFFAGCCYGKETSAWYGITFHNSEFAPNGIPLIPTQLISSGLNFIHCLILLWFAKRAKKPGQVAALYLILYSIGRYGVEMLRNDPRGSIASLSTSQFISIFMLLMGIALMIFCTKTQQKSIKDILAETEKEETYTENK